MASSAHLNQIDGAITTSDATTTQILQIPCFESDVTMLTEVWIVARRQSTSDAKTWQQVMLIDKTGGGTPTQASAVNLMTPSGTLGSATWNFSMTFDANHAIVNVIGQAGAIINWFASAWGMQVMGD